LLVAVTVKVTFEPTATMPLLAVLVTATSAWETIVVASLALSLAVFTSPPPATLAVLVRKELADWATATVTEIGGNDPLPAIAAVLVQVTVCPTIPQVQPVPTAAIGVRPAGRVSVTVVVPLVAVPPILLAVSVYTPVLPRTRGSVWVFAIVRSEAQDAPDPAPGTWLARIVAWVPVAPGVAP